MIRIINFDVGQADCFLLHFSMEETVSKGDKEVNISKYFNLLVDGAYANRKIETKLREQLGEEKIQGIVVTHVDNDHISGILSIVKKNINGIKDAFFIFNQYDENLISYIQAKQLAEEIKSKFKNNFLIKSYKMNFSEDDNININKNRNVDEELEVKLMSLGQRKKVEKIEDKIVNITILGPDKTDISKFMRNWHKNKKDAEITNAASVVLLIEFDGKAILMSGDGYFSNIEQSLDKIEIDKIDIIKASHHGAKANNNRLCEIAKKYECEKILFTITGKKNENHPDMELVKKLISDTDADLFCSATISEDNELKYYMEQKTDTELG